VAAIAEREIRRFMTDRPRLLGALLIPFLFVALMGGILQVNLGRASGFNFVGFMFTGVLGMTLFQSAAAGMASLLEDRQSGLAQDIFVAPVSRLTIVLGKIGGESVVALLQGLPLFGLAIVLGVRLRPDQAPALLAAALVTALLGGAFGLGAMAMVRDQRGANHVFQFLLLPQLLLGGVLNPIRVLPWYLEVPSRLAPLRYAVDLIRGAAYGGSPEASRVVLASPLFDAAACGLLFTLFLAAGTALFVRRQTLG